MKEVFRVNGKKLFDAEIITDYSYQHGFAERTQEWHSILAGKTVFIKANMLFDDYKTILEDKSLKFKIKTKHFKYKGSGTIIEHPNIYYLGTHFVNLKFHITP